MIHPRVLAKMRRLGELYGMSGARLAEIALGINVRPQYWCNSHEQRALDLKRCALRGPKGGNLMLCVVVDLTGIAEIEEDVPSTLELVAMLKALSAEERVEILSEFCRWCGTDDMPCHCMNDE